MFGRRHPAPVPREPAQPADHPLEDHDLEDHDRGLAHDLPTLLSRRRALGLFGGASLIAVTAACASDATTTTTTTSGASSSAVGGGPGGGGAPPAGGGTTVDSEAGTIPEETGGPYPADGSNGVNVLDDNGIVRSDITSSFGGSTTVAAGVPLTIRLTVVDVSEGSAALAGAAVYLWHCDREGRYSLYSDGVTGENYLRGVQETDRDGRVTFTSIFPACYSGRWPHIHFEVYGSLADATAATNKLRTSQLALPADVCADVFATEGYDASVSNLAQVSLDSDNAFSDGYSLQLAAVTGDAGSGYTAVLSVPV